MIKLVIVGIMLVSTAVDVYQAVQAVRVSKKLCKEMSK